MKKVTEQTLSFFTQDGNIDRIGQYFAGFYGNKSFSILTDGFGEQNLKKSSEALWQEYSSGRIIPAGTN